MTIDWRGWSSWRMRFPTTPWWFGEDGTNRKTCGVELELTPAASRASRLNVRRDYLSRNWRQPFPTEGWE